MSARVVCAASADEQLRAAGYETLRPAECTATDVKGGIVVVLDGLEEGEVTSLEEMLGDTAERRSIVVLLGRWDGFAAVPLAAVCRGIISGFGVAGVAAALRQFDEQG